MQGSLDTCPVVGPERADVSCDEFDIGVVDLPVAEYHGVIGETSLGRSSEIEDNFQELVLVFTVYEPFCNPWREFFDHFLQVGLNPLLHGSNLRIA